MGSKSQFRCIPVGKEEKKKWKERKGKQSKTKQQE
jgi:hypothetical protein